MVTLKSCDHGVVCLYPMFSFLLLVIVFRFQNSFVDYHDKLNRVFFSHRANFPTIIKMPMEKSC